MDSFSLLHRLMRIWPIELSTYSIVQIGVNRLFSKLEAGVVNLGIEVNIGQFNNSFHGAQMKEKNCSILLEAYADSKLEQ
jgi:hypothetical protein